MLASSRAARKVVRKLVARLRRGAPPEPADEVLVLLKKLKVKQVHLIQMYDVFHYLKQSENEDKDIVDATSIEVDTIRKIVKERRKWVIKLLLRLIDLGGCKETLSWNNFLWILLRFASLSRPELAQTMFLLIQTEVASHSIHYLTAMQLQEFYDFYRDCPVEAFNSRGMDFDKLPLCRFYAPDFVELTQRFEALLNPLLELQRVVQGHLPGHSFWDNAETQLFCRKIYFDFFVMGTSRVHLRGEPPFRETCDLLLPDALGGAPTNIEQWVMRTSHCRSGRGLRQVSAFGEQPPPELIREIRRQLAEEAAAAAAAEAERQAEQALALAAARRRAAAALARTATEAAMPKLELQDEAEAEAEPEGPAAPGGAATAASELGDAAATGTLEPTLPREAWTPERTLERPGRAAGGQSTAVVPLAAGAAAAAPGRRGPGVEPTPAPAAAPEPAGPLIDGNALSLYAATLDETAMGPMDCLPPSWMKGATIAPAPQLPGWGCKPGVRTFARTTDTWGTDMRSDLGRSY